MKEFPWEKSLAEITKFDQENDTWVCSIPELTQNELWALVQKCLPPEFLSAVFLLGNALDQPQLNVEIASRSFNYLKQLHSYTTSAFAALALSPATSTQHLIWMITVLGNDLDVYDHAIHNLQKRIHHDSDAVAFMSTHSSLVDE